MFTLTIQTDNAAFGDGDDSELRNEIARICRQAADMIEGGSHEIGNLRDTNGNTVGQFSLT